MSSVAEPVWALPPPPPPAAALLSTTTYSMLVSSPPSAAAPLEFKCVFYIKNTSRLGYVCSHKLYKSVYSLTFKIPCDYLLAPQARKIKKKHEYT